jgi:hypothetical protein
MSRRLINRLPSKAYSTNSISLGRQVLLIHGSSGPYTRRIVNQPLLGTVSSQLPSLPWGGLCQPTQNPETRNLKP